MNVLPFSLPATDLALLGRGEGPRRHLHRVPQEGQVPLAVEEHTQRKYNTVRILVIQVKPPGQSAPSLICETPET